jgi:hypothetical protein
MKLDLSRRIAVGASLILGLALATPFGQQAPTLFAGSQAPPGVPFPVEETTIRQIHAAYLAGKTTAHAITQAYIKRIVAYVPPLE